MESRAERISKRLETVVDPRTSLAMWLRAGRAERKLSLDDVARITKIQPRILEKLEAGHFDGLPAEVFVRGFVRSVARCVGLDEAEALVRYGKCAQPTAGEVGARALVETMSPLAPVTARIIARVPAATPPEPTAVVVEVASIVETEPVVEAAEATPVVEAEPAIEAAPVAEAAPKKKRAPRKKAATGATPTAPRTRKKKTTAAPDAVAATESEPIAVTEPVAVTESEPVAVTESTPVDVPAETDTTTSAAIEVIDATDAAAWQPTMPPVAPSVPWRRPTFSTAVPAYVAPSLVIDDANPDSADEEREAREAAKVPNRVSFLPPILLDRDDKSGRQGGLTLAVIILLIAATLTLSYLMRRPSLSGDGVTMADSIAHRLA
jgi:hypothetical protein